MRFDELVVFSRDVGRAVRRSAPCRKCRAVGRRPEAFAHRQNQRKCSRRGEGEDYALAVFQKSLYLVEIARKRFGVLRAGVEHLPQRIQSASMICACSLASRMDFDRADLDAFITVFTVCLLQADDAHLDGLLSCGQARPAFLKFHF